MDTMSVMMAQSTRSLKTLQWNLLSITKRNYNFSKLLETDIFDKKLGLKQIIFSIQ